MTELQASLILELLDRIVHFLELIARWQFYGVAMCAILIGVTLCVIWSNYKPFC